MKLIESYLDLLQTEKLDTNELMSKIQGVFRSIYNGSVEECMSRQKEEDYSNPYADRECEEKAQIEAYKGVSKHLNKLISKCRDAICVNKVKSEQNRIQFKLNSLIKQTSHKVL